MINEQSVKEWFKKEESQGLLLDLKAHLSHSRALELSQIECLMHTFPQFIYEGPAFRVILSQGEERYSLKWDNSLENRSWSLSDDFLYSFLREYLHLKSTDNHFFQVFKAHIRGFNLPAFSQFLKNKEGAYELVSILETHGHEQEIIALEFSSPVFQYDGDSLDSLD